MRYRILNEDEGFSWIGFEYCSRGFSNPSTLEEAVDILLQNGWEPLGGVSSIGTAKRAYLVQAMIFTDNTA